MASWTQSWGEHKLEPIFRCTNISCADQWSTQRACISFSFVWLLMDFQSGSLAKVTSTKIVSTILLSIWETGNYLDYAGFETELHLCLAYISFTLHYIGFTFQTELHLCLALHRLGIPSLWDPYSICRSYYLQLCCSQVNILVPQCGLCPELIWVALIR